MGILLTETQLDFIFNNTNKTTEFLSDMINSLSRIEEAIEETAEILIFTPRPSTLEADVYVDLQPAITHVNMDAVIVRPILKKTSLIIPDAHIIPGQSLERFDKLGKLIADKRPDTIFQMGDFLSLSSLSHWDKNKKLSVEGKRYKEDIRAGKEAIKRLFAPLRALQEQQKADGLQVYTPEVVWIIGNHEDWIRQYTIYNPALAGHLDIVEDLGIGDMGFKIIPFKGTIEKYGIIFSHVPMNGGSMPVSGKTAIFKAQEQCSKSQVFAHTHRWEHMSHKRHGDDDIMQTLSVGYFNNVQEEYCEGAPLGWWSGVTMLSHWKYGRFDASQISLERLMEMY